MSKKLISDAQALECTLRIALGQYNNDTKSVTKLVRELVDRLEKTNDQLGAQVGWMTSISGEYQFFKTQEDAIRERTEFLEFEGEEYDGCVWPVYKGVK